MKEQSLQKILGDNITRYRIERGITQAQLAEHADVSTAFLSRVERGQKMMKISTLLAIADALKISCDALFREDSVDTRLENIINLLKDQPREYIIAVEHIVRVCLEEFVPYSRVNVETEE